MAAEEKKDHKKRLFPATSIIVVALLIVIAANAVVWQGRLARSAEIDSLHGEITKITQEIKKTPPAAADLETRLADARAGLAAAQTAFPTEFNRNDIIDFIILLARECQVEVLPISSQGWSVEQGHSVLKLNATLTGSFTQANEFIARLQNGKYETLVVPEISFTRQSGTVGSGSFSGDNTMVTVKLSVSVYASPAAIVKGNNG
jgi:hypothetical protein